MADYVLARKSRNIVSTLVHVFLNLLLGIGSVLITVLSGSPLLGLILVFASKWRMFAVRSRYLWLNIKSNLVDLIVGISVVLLSYFAGPAFLPVDLILMVNFHDLHLRKTFLSFWINWLTDASMCTALIWHLRRNFLKRSGIKTNL